MMKTLTISIIIGFSIQLSAVSQNRINNWETENIRSIIIESSSMNQEKETTVIKSPQDMDRIISFLKSISCIQVDSFNASMLEENNDTQYKISFEGQRDQVYLYRKSARIGKTSFITDPDVMKNFGILIKELIANDN